MPILAVGALAKPLPDTGTPMQVQALLACRSVTDSNQRLACYDKAAQGFAEAVGKKEVVVDRQGPRHPGAPLVVRIHRSQFRRAVRRRRRRISQIEGIVQNVIENGDGTLTLTLADGSTWTQIDDTPVALPPRRGDKIVIRRGALGALFRQDRIAARLSRRSASASASPGGLGLQAGLGVDIGFLPLDAPVSQLVERNMRAPVTAQTTWSPSVSRRNVPGR